VFNGGADENRFIQRYRATNCGSEERKKKGKKKKTKPLLAFGT